MTLELVLVFLEPILVTFWVSFFPLRAGEATGVDLAAGLVETFLMRRLGFVDFVMVMKKVKKRRVAGYGGWLVR